ncbi:hypothetical protein LJR039_001314 [Pseudorhodoferax sp. LjRoot39]|uniref:hypothetical protein n=1 Tax=Pseudorhodoferax sp. LjRoot39 TaxID=3342328 RepID=UPI003ECE398F
MPKPTSVARIRREPIAKLAVGRLLSDFQPLLPGEQALLLACRRGEVAELGASLPEVPTDTRHIRAPFLRFLLLGGDAQAPVHERGVQLKGAYVTDQLDLTGCRIPYNVSLKCCRFVGPVRAQDARVEGLMTLEESHLAQGLNADRLRCAGGLFLRHRFKAVGQVRLLSAHIGGDLECGGGHFERTDKEAFRADGAVVKGDVIFNDGFKATGTVQLLGAQIGGDLQCCRGQFEGNGGDALLANRAFVAGSVFFNSDSKGTFKATGTVSLSGAHIGGKLECADGKFEAKNGDALSAERVVVKGSVFLNRTFRATGQVRLRGAQIGGDLACSGGQFEAEGKHALLLKRAVVMGAWLFNKLETPVRVDASHMEVAVLVDAIDSWAAGSVLDGLRYGALHDDARALGKARLGWLQKQSVEHLGGNGRSDDFRPQPWRQLQHVLRDMGHAEDARQIGVAFEQQLYRIGRIGQSREGVWPPVAWCRRVVARSGHSLFGMLSGYGYRPMRLMAWMTLVWLFCAFCYWRLALPPHGAIGPSDPLVFQHERYASCVSDSPVAVSAAGAGTQNARNWYLCGPLLAEYSTFSPLAYSLDLLLPLVDLGQDKAWGALVPTPQATPWNEFLAFSPGHLVRWLVWFQTLFGWIASLLLVGIVSGFARRSEE